MKQSIFLDSIYPNRNDYFSTPKHYQMQLPTSSTLAALSITDTTSLGFKETPDDSSSTTIKLFRRTPWRQYSWIAFIPTEMSSEMITKKLFRRSPWRQYSWIAFIPTENDYFSTPAAHTETLQGWQGAGRNHYQRFEQNAQTEKYLKTATKGNKTTSKDTQKLVRRQHHIRIPDHEIKWGVGEDNFQMKKW